MLKNCRSELLRKAASFGNVFWPLITIAGDSKDFSLLDIFIATITAGL
jgi:hypothetical protein